MNTSRGRLVSLAILQHYKSLLASADHALGSRLDIEATRKDFDVKAEKGDPTLRVYATGQTRERDENAWTIKPEVALLFTAPLGERSGEKTRDYWESVAEAYVNTLPGVKMAGYLLDSIEAVSLWDPETLAAGRFAAQWNATYLGVEYF